MNFTKSDFFIGMAMTIAVVFMSFTFPALGMTGDAVQENEIPEFNITKGSVEFAKEKPEFPARPSGGELEYVNGSESWQDNRQTYLQRGDTEYLISFFDTTPNNAQPTWEINLIKFNSTGSFQVDDTISEGEAKTLTSVDGSYKVGFDNLDVDNNTRQNETARVDWEVIEQPLDKTWVGRIPVVGGLVSDANQLASVLGWIGSMIWHFVVKVLLSIGNTLLIFFNIVTYIIDFMHWLINTYATVIAGAPTTWASVIVAIPGVLLSFEFFKLIAIGISLLPLT